MRLDIRTLSRAFDWNPQRFIKAMVQRMTRIVITTISSTKVNPRKEVGL